jgi:uncharacterized membrane protein YeaQ/YmgE (transglycosylase-associated protein family)
LVARAEWKAGIVTLFLSWLSLGVFTGLIWNQLYGDRASIVPNISAAATGAVGLGLLLRLTAGGILPDWAIVTSFLPAIAGAVIALLIFRALGLRTE